MNETFLIARNFTGGGEGSKKTNEDLRGNGRKGTEKVKYTNAQIQKGECPDP